MSLQLLTQPTPDARRRDRRPPAEPSPQGFGTTNWFRGLLAISAPTFYRWLSMGRVGPRPLRVNERCIRWRVEEVMRWIDAGCPSRSEWDDMKQAAA